jgi:polyhydroxyalkanoate synthesis regulator phasin
MLASSSTTIPKGSTMIIDDFRRTVEGLLGTLTPAKAQQLAKDMMEPGAAKEQVAKTTADLLEWSQANRERWSSFVRREISEQLKTVGMASQSELDALKKRVRDLERAAGMTASGRAKSTKTGQRKRTAKKTTAARKTSTPKSSSGSGPTPAG